MADRQVFVGPFVRRQDRDVTGEKAFNNVYVKNLSEGCTEEFLAQQFSQRGEITSVAIMKDADGKSKGFGFVNFLEPDAAKKAVEELDGFTHEDKQWVVNKAQRKSEREQELRSQREQVGHASGTLTWGQCLSVLQILPEAPLVNSLAYH